MKLIIQIPCYNEEESLPVTLAALPKYIEGVDLIETLVISDGSTDKTTEVANWTGVNHVVVLNKHQGLAAAFKAGITKAIQCGADIIVNTDADNQYCADDIEKLVRPILENKADIVIGARPISDIKAFSFLKKIFQKIGSCFISLLSSAKIDDAPSGFRAFSRDAANVLNIFDNYSYTMETIVQASAKGLRIANVPVKVNPEIRKSKLVKNMFDYIKRSAFTMIRMFIVYKPFKFFASIGALFLIAGFAFCVRFVWLFLAGNGAGHVQSLILASILILTGVQIEIIAILADLLAINRKLIEDVQLRIKKLEKND